MSCWVICRSTVLAAALSACAPPVLGPAERTGGFGFAAPVSTHLADPPRHFTVVPGARPRLAVGFEPRNLLQLLEPGAGGFVDAGVS